MTRVHIEASSAVARAGLNALLEHSASFEIVDRAELADVIIRDDSAQALEALAGHDSLPIVLLSDEPFTKRVLRSGIRAVLPHHAEHNQIFAALHAAAAGLIALPADAVELLASGREPNESPIDPLTSREQEVLEMLAEGLSNKQIAGRLNVSDHTAKFHVNSILGKLDAGTRTEAVTRGIRAGILKI